MCLSAYTHWNPGSVHRNLSESYQLLSTGIKQKMEYTMFIGMIFLMSFAHDTNGLCIFGSADDCFFPCHCSSLYNNTCNPYTGACTGGCEGGKPQYYDWQGPACQVGNLAYQKPTISNTAIHKTSKHYNRPHLWYDTNKTTDGILKLRVFDGSCAVVYTDKKTIMPWIMVDLQTVYMVTKVVLINTDNSVDASFLETLDIKIGNDTNIEDQQLCKRWTVKVGSGRRVTIICTSPILGRYVSLKKYSERNKVGRLPLCEIVVIGHKYLDVNWEKCMKPSEQRIWCEHCAGMIPPDCKIPCPANAYGRYCEGQCGHCQAGKMCDKTDGTCEACELGWKPPKCDVPCPNNTYGYGCQNQCGKCKDNAQCDLNTGKCGGQCQIWYAQEDELCETFISMVNADGPITVMFTKATWALLSTRLDYPYTLAKYYIFKLYYLHENDPLSNYKDYDNYTIHYNNETHEVQIHILALHPATQYWFAMQVFRVDRNQTEGGIPSAPIKLMTQRNGGVDTTQKNPDTTVKKPTTTANVPGQILHKKKTRVTADRVTDIKTAHSKSGDSVIPSHHVSTLTVALNLVIFTILIAVGVGIGVYFYRKRQSRKMPSRLNNTQRDPNNICYTSQVGIIDQTDDLHNGDY